jgi:hypothetical protein
MLSNYGYGLTDNSPNTPWNDPGDPPDHDFDCTCTQVLSKTSTVTTNSYNLERDQDEDGYWEGYDTSNVCWADEYHDNDHYTPLQLIELFKAHLEEELKSDAVAKEKISKYKHLISECEDWSEDETDYEGE